MKLDTVPDNESCAMYALLALGRREEAVAFMNRVIANDSVNPGNFYDAACFTSRLGDAHKALDYLNTAFEKGFRRFHHVRHDDDLDAIRSLPEFEEILAKYENFPSPEIPTETAENNPGSGISEAVEIPFTRADGVTMVDCSINGLPLKFIFDTGASIVSMSMVEANFMMKNGYLKPGDVVGQGNLYDANGDIRHNGRDCDKPAEDRLRRAAARQCPRLHSEEPESSPALRAIGARTPWPDRD